MESESLIESDEAEDVLGGRTVVTVQHDEGNLGIKQRCMDKWNRVKNNWLCRELYMLLTLAIPIIIAFGLEQAYAVISLAFVGHSTDDNSIILDSIGLGFSYVTVTGLAVGVGLSSAADTLCAQAYGYKNYKRVGIIFQRGVLILGVVVLLVWCVWLNTESLLLLWQQPPCVSRYTSYFVRIFAASLPFFFLYVMLQKYLQSQSIVWPFLVIGVISNIICVALHAIFITAAHLSVIGASISLVLSNISIPLMLILYVRIRKLHKQTWGGWSWESLKGWGQFLKLGIPGMGMICIEWISFEISTFIVGSLGEVQLAVNAILMNLTSIIFTVPLGMSIAVSIRVGNELGAGNPKGAKKAAYVSCGVIMVNSVITIAIVELSRNHIGKLYNATDDVNEILPTVLHVLSALLFTDQLQAVISGVIRGAGHQLWGAAVTFIAYYVVGLPIGISLALATDLGVLGMWIGLLCGSAFHATIYVIILLLIINWEKESQKAIKIASDNCEESDNGTALELETPEESMVEKLEEPHETQLELDDNDDTLVLQQQCNDLDTKGKIKLLISRSGVLIVAVVLVVASGIASQYNPPDSVINGNYSECTGNLTLY